MVGYYLMAEGHSIQLGSGRRCEPPSKSKVAPWWWLEFFEKFFEYKASKDV